MGAKAGHDEHSSSSWRVSVDAAASEALPPDLSANGVARAAAEAAPYGLDHAAPPARPARSPVHEVHPPLVPAIIPNLYLAAASGAPVRHNQGHASGNPQLSYSSHENKCCAPFTRACSMLVKDNIRDNPTSAHEQLYLITRIFCRCPKAPIRIAVCVITIGIPLPRATIIIRISKGYRCIFSGTQ